jgi:hypothetical protein
VNLKGAICDAHQRGSTKDSQRSDSLAHGQGETHKLQCHVHSAAASLTQQLCDGIYPVGVDGHGTKLFGQGKLVWVEDVPAR